GAASFPAMKLISALIGTALAIAPVAAFAQGQDVEKITADFEKPKGDTADAKHTPVLDAPASVTAGEWFNVKISVGKDALHPSWHDHHVRWIALEADGVEINRVYLHPTMSKPEVTFVVALPDARTFDKDGAVTKRADRTVTLRAVETPTHTSQWWSEKKIT